MQKHSHQLRCFVVTFVNIVANESCEMDTITIAQVSSSSSSSNHNHNHISNAPPRYSTLAGGENWDHTYRPLPELFFGLALLWMLLVVVWTANTWSKRRWQTSNLQWVLTVIPAMKSLVMGLSFVFWYSCLHLRTCSFWVAFGVFVSRIFFETACFVTFLLISYGYCIMHEQLSLTERRSVAGLTSLLYLTLTGYKAAVPQFAVLIIFIYAVLLYVIMAHIARNLSLLREQLQQIQTEGVHMMQNAVHTKYTMFRKFQGAVLAMVVAEILMQAQAGTMVNEYWVRLLVREVTEVTIFFFIGWTFRSREQTPFFNVMPTSNAAGQRTLAPIYSVEMNERQFSKLDYKEWHIGVPTPICRAGERPRPMLVIVQNPGVSDADTGEQIPSTTSDSQQDQPHPGHMVADLPCHWDPKPRKHHEDDDDDGDVPADVKKQQQQQQQQQQHYSFLAPFENPCCEIVARPLHARSNSTKCFTASVHYQAYNNSSK